MPPMRRNAAEVNSFPVEPGWLYLQRWSMKQVILLTLGVLLSIAELGEAGTILDTHALVGGYTLYGGLKISDGNYLPGESVRIEGNGSLGTGELDDIVDNGPHGIYAGFAAAATGVYADDLLKAMSSSSSTGHHTFDNYGNADAWAGWRDVIYAPSAGPTETLRLEFQVDGGLNATSEYIGLGSTSKLAIDTTDDPATFFDTPGFDHYANSVSIGDPGDFSATYGAYTNSEGIVLHSFEPEGLWDSVHLDGNHFSGTFHIDAHYNSLLGGYGWGVILHAESFAFGGSAAADFFDTMALSSVTLADGTPVDVTFDSGLTFAPTAATPEPSTLALFSLGAIGFVLRRCAYPKARKSHR